MKTKIKKFLRDNLNRRKKFELAELEEYLLREAGGQTGYAQLGGYQKLCQSLIELQEEELLRPIRNSPSNGRRPPLKSRWIKIEKEKGQAWNDRDIFRLSDRLDLSYYLRHPEYQTEQEWQWINNIYQFLQEKDRREWASLEERSLELFGDEKFLTSNKKSVRNKIDNRILQRLGLSPADLKARKYGQMFVYWNKGVKEIREILILENHSTFFSCKRAIEEGLPIFGLEADALIYGQGKHIVKSLSFIGEIADPDLVKIFYFGDIDPEGFLIYYLLKKKYPDLFLKLHLPSYWELMDIADYYYPCYEQNKQRKVLDFIVSEMKENSFNKPADEIYHIWKNDLRIPQELITYEHIKSLNY